MSFIGKLLAAIAISLLASTPAPADESNLSTCVFSAMFGPNYKFVQIMNHEFNCKKMVRFPLPGGGVLFSGQLSHHSSGALDDQVYFQFNVRDGTLESLKTRINRGGWGHFAGPAASVIGAIYGVPISVKQAQDVWDTLGQAVKGRGWEEVSEVIVGSIAAHVAAVASLPEGTYIQQKSTGKYLDAYHSDLFFRDFGVVLRSQQDNDTQKWIIESTGKDAAGNEKDTFFIIQKSSGRYLDAYQGKDKDFRLVTRLRQDNKTQQWKLTSLGNDAFGISQVGSGRNADAHNSGDFWAVTRDQQDNDTQKWIVVLE
jgi:hypothetical protein